jgi:lipoprotein-anchoring transpeptidase ErfK/SrfK
MIRPMSPRCVALAVAALAFGAPGSAAAGTSSVVAQAKHATIELFGRPAAHRPLMHWSSPVAGVPATFLVKRRRRGWDEVYVPRRPNGSTGWLRERDVTLYRDPYRVDVSLGAHRLVVWRGRRRLFAVPVGVGKSSTPTPTGRYFLVELFKQSDPYGPYGPYAFGTSAFSNALFSFGGGPGQIGLHGTDEPALVGTDVSHGCLRVRNAAIVRLARILPLGTPLTVTR